MEFEKKQEGEFAPYPGWKMHVYTPSRMEFSACSYYRQEVPLLGLARLGLAEGFIDKGEHHYDKTTRDEQSVLAMLTADINLLYAVTGQSGLSLYDTFKNMRAGTIGGKLIYPPSLIYDIDDNLDWVHPFNVAYTQFGTRTPDGNLLKEGDNVITRLANGREIVTWQDHVTVGEKGFVFDVARNLTMNKLLHEFAAKCDGFTTPSPYLAKYMKENHGYPEPYVYPNSIVPEHWHFPKFAPRKKEVRILWQGGGSHSPDWFALKPAIQLIAKKFPHVKFVIFGTQYPWITDAIPEKQLELHDWVPYAGYKATRAMMDADINLCVLRDDDFSRSKSAIKFYEGAIQARPEATLAPNMPPYNAEIVDGETGLLYDTGPTPQAAAESFAANLEHLIVNADLRRKVAEAGHDWVLENRHYLKTARALYEDYYYPLRVQKMKDKPYDPDRDKLPPAPEPVKKPKGSRSKRKAVKARKKKR